jgi:hypothetical protein
VLFPRYASGDRRRFLFGVLLGLRGVDLGTGDNPDRRGRILAVLPPDWKDLRVLAEAVG